MIIPQEASLSLDGCESGAGLCCLRYFLSRTAECTGTFKDPPDPGWNNNLDLGFLGERVSVLNAKLSIDSLGKKEDLFTSTLIPIVVGML